MDRKTNGQKRDKKKKKKTKETYRQVDKLIPQRVSVRH